MNPSWNVVLCAKGLASAKQRLSPLGSATRRALAQAMFQDIMVNVCAVREVGKVVLVSNDPELPAFAHEHGAVTSPDPGWGINEAFLAGTRLCVDDSASTDLTPTDLPCVSAGVIAKTLRVAARYRVAVVPDRKGDGTVFPSHAPGVPFRPRFGYDSFAAYRTAGACPIRWEASTVRCDIDSPPDLYVAAQLGVGESTRRAIAASRATFLMGLNRWAG